MSQNYKDKLIEQINELDIVLRRCFAHQTQTPEDGETVDWCTNAFLHQIIPDSMFRVTGVQITLSRVLRWHDYYDMPIEELIKQECYHATSYWLKTNMFKCDGCGQWFFYDEDDTHREQTTCLDCEMEVIYGKDKQ